MNFKEWLKLQEVGTGTNAIAMFKRPVFAEPFRRSALAPWGEEDPFFKKKSHIKEDTKATSSAAQTLPQSDQPTLQMPLRMKKGKK